MKRTESETGRCEQSKFQIETKESALSLVNVANRQEYAACVKPCDSYV